MFYKLKFDTLLKPLLCSVFLVVMTGCGGGSDARAPSEITQSSVATPIISPPSMTLLSGAPGGLGNADGEGGRFSVPVGIAFDTTGNLIVSDGQAVRRVDTLFKVSTLFVPADCLFPFPWSCSRQFGGITVGPDGTIFMAQTDSHNIVRILPSGQQIGFVGTGWRGAADGSVFVASFSSPDSVVADTRGVIYVADTGNGTIRRVLPDGTTNTLAGLAGSYEVSDGTGPEARFGAPVGIARDNDGNLYVGDRNTIRRISPSGVVRTIAGSPGEAGSVDGVGSVARFGLPNRLAIDKAGNILVADSGNFTIRRVTQSGVVSTITGIIGQGDDAGNSKLVDSTYLARGIGYLAIDKSDNLFFADSNNGLIRKMAPDGRLSTVAGLRARPGKLDGPATIARFDEAGGSMITDSAGNLYVSASRTIRKVAPDGSVTSLLSQADPAMEGIFLGYTESNPKGNKLNPYFPTAIPYDGSVYAIDQRRLYKFAANGTKTFIAGSLAFKAADGIGAAASFSAPSGLTVDASGNVYLLDRELIDCCLAHGFPYFADGEWQSIRKITPTGVVTTIVGCTTSKNCVSTIPFRISTFAMDRHGDFYVTDSTSVRKIGANGVIRTLAEIGNIEVLAVGGDDTVYVADNTNYEISKISSNGTITLLAGRSGMLGAVSGALPSTIGKVVGMTVGTDNTLFVMMENAIFKIK